MNQWIQHAALAGPPGAFDAEKFARIVEHARKHNPFYREWLGAGVGEAPPVVTRADFQANNARILNGRRAEFATSGSTNTPVSLAWSPRRRQVEREDEAMLVEWLGGPLAAMQSLTFGKVAPGANEIEIHAPVGQQVAFLFRLRDEAGIRALTTFASNAVLLAEHLLATAGPQAWVERVGLLSESLFPWEEARLREAFPRAQIWSTYSSKEFGILAIRCPDHPAHWHVRGNKLGLEILDGEGRWCPPGVTGRLVVTDYFNTYAPCIRYDIGDLGAWGNCGCGRPGPVLGALHGKVRQAFVMSDGSRKPTYQLVMDFRKIAGLRQHQIIQEAVGRFVVKCVADRRVEEEVRRYLTRFLGAPPEALRCDYGEAIPRHPGGKFFTTWSLVE